MVQSRLPFPDIQIMPSETIDEPDIWLRRLVFISRPEPSAKVIRWITFRRGVNIIATEQRTKADIAPVGHSVGKSLLVRIIRYCLGEDRFCTPSLRLAITQKLERAYVLVALRVKGVDWTVARPNFPNRCPRSILMSQSQVREGGSGKGKWVKRYYGVTKGKEIPAETACSTKSCRRSPSSRRCSAYCGPSS